MNRNDLHQLGYQTVVLDKLVEKWAARYFKGLQTTKQQPLSHPPLGHC